MSAISDLYKAAEALKDAGKIDEAIAKLQECLAIDEKYLLAHLALAVACGKAGKHDEAIRHALRACEIEPQDSFNYMALSVTFKRAFDATQDMRYVHLAEEAKARSQMLEGHHHHH